MEDYKPKSDETIGKYLRRLREAAGEVQGRPIKLTDVAGMTENLAKPQKFTTSWLSNAENDVYEAPGVDRLRTLAGIYTRLLHQPVPDQWLLELAGHDVGQPIVQLTQSNDLTQFLQYEAIAALIIVSGKLLEQGYPQDVEVLLGNAYRFLRARNSGMDITEIYDDPLLAHFVKEFIERMDL